MQINYANDPAGGCLVAFWPGSSTVGLAGDTGGQWAFTGTLGTGTLQNSYCRIDLAASSFTKTGNNLTVNLAITFLPALPGLQQIWMLCGDNGGLTGSWQQMGTWTTTAVSSQPPAPVSVLPVSGTGTAQTFTYVASSDKTSAYITQLYVLFSNTPGATANACFVVYNSFQRVLVLIGESGVWDSSVQTTALATGAAIHNSHCTVDPVHSSASGSGNNLTLVLALSFDPSWMGTTKSNYLSVSDRGGVYSDWAQEGAWTIGTPAPPTVTTSTLALGTVGTAYSQTLTASGAVQPCTWSLVSGSLPAGLSLSQGGVISGTPTMAGIFTFDVRVTDYNGVSSTRQLSISIPDNSISTDARRIGVRPTGAYWGAAGEQIDLLSGNLNFALPLIRRAIARRMGRHAYC